jgi:hypothetical protein
MPASGRRSRGSSVRAMDARSLPRPRPSTIHSLALRAVTVGVAATRTAADRLSRCCPRMESRGVRHRILIVADHRLRESGGLFGKSAADHEARKGARTNPILPPESGGRDGGERPSDGPTSRRKPRERTQSRAGVSRRRKPAGSPPEGRAGASRRANEPNRAPRTLASTSRHPSPCVAPGAFGLRSPARTNPIGPGVETGVAATTRLGGPGRSRAIEPNPEGRSSARRRSPCGARPARSNPISGVSTGRPETTASGAHPARSNPIRGGRRGSGPGRPRRLTKPGAIKRRPPISPIDADSEKSRNERRPTRAHVVSIRLSSVSIRGICGCFPPSSPSSQSAKSAKSADVFRPHPLSPNQRNRRDSSPRRRGRQDVTLGRGVRPDRGRAFRARRSAA